MIYKWKFSWQQVPVWTGTEYAVDMLRQTLLLHHVILFQQDNATANTTIHFHAFYKCDQ